MTLELIEYQYEELVRYEDGRPMQMGAGGASAGPSKNLIRRNLLTRVPRAGTGFYCITEYGRAALVAFRELHGVPAPATLKTVLMPPCARCAKEFDQHPGGFCPDQVGGDGMVHVATAEAYVLPEPS